MYFPIIVFEFILFLFFLFICVYLPGKFFLIKLKLKVDAIEDVFLSISIGLLLFISLVYVVSWVQLEMLLIPLFLVIAYITVKTKQWLPQIPEKKHRKPLLFVILLGLFFSLGMVTSGIFGDTTIYQRDDLWHLALINELKAHFPPDNPAISGIPLHGYHFFYNLVLAKTSTLFSLSPFSLHFHLFPLLFSLLWSVGVYVLMFKWSRSIATAVWAVFLTMFSGSFAFILAMQGRTGFGFSNGLGMLQPSNSLYNPPFSFSIIVIITALFSLYCYLSTNQKKWLVPLTLCIGLVAMIKVYAGIILVGGFLVLTVLQLFKKKFEILFALLGITFLFLSTYWLFAGNAGQLIFYPLWMPHSLLRNFPWYGYDEKMHTYMQQHVVKGIIETEIFGLFLIIAGNLGTRIIGIFLLLFFMLKKRIYPTLFSVIVFVMAGIAILVPLLFIQSGKVFEIVQMTQYFLFFSAFAAAFGFSKFFALHFQRSIKIFLFLALLIATLPSAYSDYASYLTRYKMGQSLSTPYYQTMNFLSQQESYDATVLEMPPKTITITDKSLHSWYEYSSSPAIVAFANKRSYFNNEFIEFPGVDNTPRFQLLKTLITFAHVTKRDLYYQQLKSSISSQLKKNEIHFIYSPYPIKSFDTVDGIKKVYQNQSYTIYKVL
jgi:hypothetical protein